MKLALCINCKTVIEAHAPTEPMTFNICPCKQSAITYTGEGNEVAIKGPLVILGVDDEQWNAVQTMGRDRRIMPAFVTVPVNSSTVLNLDATPEQQAAVDEATHVRKADGLYFKLIERIGGNTPVVTIEGMDGKQVTIQEDLFNISYVERSAL